LYRGKALLWANTEDSDPGSSLELRSRHEAKPVLKGRKYAANAWVHQYNFKIPNLWGCTGAFDVI
jgi:prolyl 4-hydroxylase